MNRWTIGLLALGLQSAYAGTLPEVGSFSQQQIYTNWVQNRCIGKITDSESLKNDAKASAAAWLEASHLPVEVYDEADKLIDSQLKEKLGGTASGQYQVLKCTLIANSTETQKLFSKHP